MMEILDIFGIDWRLLLVQIVNFGIVLVALWYFLFRPIARVVAQRQQKIEQGVADAEAAAHEREKIAEERTQIITQAQHDAEATVAQAKQYGQEKMEELKQEGQRQKERIINEAEQEAAQIKQEAHRQVQEEVARLAVLSAEQILKERADGISRQPA